MLSGENINPPNHRRRNSTVEPQCVSSLCLCVHLQWNGRSQYLMGWGSVQLSSVSGSAEGSSDDSLWTQLLYEMHHRLLESGGLEGNLQMSTVQKDLHAKTRFKQKCGVCWDGGETEEDKTPSWSSCGSSHWIWRCSVWLLHWNYTESSEIMSGVSKLLLSKSSWTARESLQR